MKVSKQRLIHMIHEELHAVLREKSIRLEHRGISCNEKQGAERRECEEQAEDAIKINREKTQKKRMYSANDEELEALGRAKVYNMNPKLRTRSDEIKPRDVINPNLSEKKHQKENLIVFQRLDWQKIVDNTELVGDLADRLDLGTPLDEIIHWNINELLSSYMLTKHFAVDRYGRRYFMNSISRDIDVKIQKDSTGDSIAQSRITITLDCDIEQEPEDK